MNYCPYYTLTKDKTPVQASDFRAYYQWANEHPEATRVGYDERTYNEKTVCISTVYLGINHNFLNRHEEPLLWETMVFGPDDLLNYLRDHAEDDISSIFHFVFDANDIQRRYSTYKKAVDGHKGMVAYVEVCIARLTQEQLKGSVT